MRSSCESFGTSGSQSGSRSIGRAQLPAIAGNIGVCGDAHVHQ